MTMLNVHVLGAGAWGIGLGLTVFRANHNVTLWSPFQEEADFIIAKRHHPKVLSDITLPQSITVTTNLSSIGTADLILCVVPAQAVRGVIQQCRPHINKDAVIISCAKGIEIATGQFLSSIITQEAPNHRVGALAGPNFAHEVALDLPAQAVLALNDLKIAQQLCQQLSHQTFHFFPGQDVTGIDLSSAFKNVLAIGSGIVTGYGLGENARAAYLTNGLKDLATLGQRMGCSASTFNSVGGIGDIMLTCLSPTSRNMSYGIQVGQRGQLNNVDAIDHPLTEGIYTVKAIQNIMNSLHLKLPSISFVEQVLYHNINVAQAFKCLQI